MKNYFYFFTLIFFISCSNDKNKENENIRTADSTLTENKTPPGFPFNEKEFKRLNLPLVIDTLFVQKADTSNRITYQQIRHLNFNFLKSEPGDGLSHDFNGFCTIDSLKQAGKYEAYVQKLDIGMLKDCIAYKIGYADLEGKNRLFIWGLNNSSYEADPFFAGTKLIATFLNSENQITHFAIAEISGAGDPPSMSSTQATATISTDGKIDVDKIVIVDDLDTPGNEITHSVFQLKVDGNKINVVNTKNDFISTEKAAQ